MPPVPWDLGLYPIQTDLWCEMLNSAAGDPFFRKASAGTSFFLLSHTLHCTGKCKKKLHWKQNKWKKPQCFLPCLDASSWQNKSLDWELKAFSTHTPWHAKGDSRPAACPVDPGAAQLCVSLTLSCSLQPVTPGHSRAQGQDADTVFWWPLSKTI